MGVESADVGQYDPDGHSLAASVVLQKYPTGHTLGADIPPVGQNWPAVVTHALGSLMPAPPVA